jgi:hypothetical protein
MIAAARRQLQGFLQFLVQPVPAAVFATLLAFAACYSRAFVFPNIPIVQWGDQVGFFNEGSEMVSGQLPYRDYFQIVPPGTDLTYALLIKFFGLRIWIPNLVMAFLAATTALLMTLIASRLMRGFAILLPGLFLSGFVLLSSTDATHHWFSTIAILAALLVMLDGASFQRVAAAGALCGLASCFTQTKGATALLGFVLCLAVYSKPRSSEYWQKCLLLCGMALAVFAAANVYFLQAAGWRQWLFCVVLYPMRYYSVPAINNWRVLFYDFRGHTGVARWVSFPFLYSTVPLTYFVFVAAAWRRWKEDREIQWDKLLLVVITGLTMFLAVASSPSVKRLGTVSPPAMILLAWLLYRPGKIVAVLRVFLGSAAVATMIAIPARVQIRPPGYLDLPSGRAAIFEPALYDEYRWLLANTQPGQFFFGLPPLHFAFHLRNAAAIEGVTASEYTRPEQVVALVESLESHQTPMLVLTRSREYIWVKDSPSDHLGPFRAYVSRNYQITKTFSTGDEVWQRIEAPGGTPIREESPDALK